MQSNADSVQQYITEQPIEKQEKLKLLRDTIRCHIPEGFQEEMSYGMIGYVVPHTIYPAGYHCDPKLPLPFISLAAQKNFYGFYHMGIYADDNLLTWFQEEYAKRIPTKLDMGKSCVRIRKVTPEVVTLLGELCEKISVEQWIEAYETSRK